LSKTAQKRALTGKLARRGTGLCLGLNSHDEYNIELYRTRNFFNLNRRLLGVWEKRLHPDFQNIFVVPSSYEPLLYEGTLDHDKWSDGVLKTADARHSYPVLDGIPNFVDPSVKAWTEEEMEEIKKGNWIERNWKNQTQQMQAESRRTEFCRRIAESVGIILDVASGPGGGSMPGIVYFNPNAKVLMNDLGVRVLQEWRAFLRKNKIGPDVYFAAFDATCMPICSKAFDIVASSGGFGNIVGTDKALYEAFRILRRGGNLFMADGTIKEEDFFQFPREVQLEWKTRLPALVSGYESMLKDSGFSIISYEELSSGTISPNESELGKAAEKHGITLHLVGCYIQAEKK
jgi:SAM-dependent methyltransferase